MANVRQCYETFLYITGPILLPIAFAIKPRFMGMMTGIVVAMYFLLVNYFNEVSSGLVEEDEMLTQASQVTLRRKNEMVARKIVLFYYTPYKFMLRWMNVVSV